jgi:hypothetical protein
MAKEQLSEIEELHGLIDDIDAEDHDGVFASSLLAVLSGNASQEQLAVVITAGIDDGAGEVDPEPEQEAPRRRVAPEPEPEAPVRRGRRAPEEDAAPEEEAPVRRGRRAAPEPEEEAPVRRGRRAAPEPEPEAPVRRAARPMRR